MCVRLLIDLPSKLNFWNMDWQSQKCYKLCSKTNIYTNETFVYLSSFIFVHLWYEKNKFEEYALRISKFYKKDDLVILELFSYTISTAKN